MKKYIKSASFNDYDSKYENIQIDPELSYKQKQFMSLPIDVLTDPNVWSDSPIEVGKTVDKDGEIFDVYNICKSAIDTYWEEYKKFPEWNWIIYPGLRDAERIFYKKYYDFAQKCKEVYDAFPTATGYGRYDIFKLKIEKGLKGVEYNFPYGWKS